jgi:hypothetical protein
MLCISSLNLSSVSGDDLEKHSHVHLKLFFFFLGAHENEGCGSLHHFFAKEVGGQSKFVRGKGKFMCKALDYD